MVKEVIWKPGRVFREFTLLPDGETTKACLPHKVSLETRLAPNLVLPKPFTSAAMMSVTGYEMAVAMQREGGLGVLPVKLPIDEQADMVTRVKNTEMTFVEDPVTIYDTATIGEALELIAQHGHSKIPIVDRNNVFKGLFDQNHYWTLNVTPNDNVRAGMISVSGVPAVNKPQISVDEAKHMLAQDKKNNYLVVLDDQDRLVKLAFERDVEQLKVGAAISTHPGWKDRVKAIVDAGVDLVVIDTSDAYDIHVKECLLGYKAMGIEVPICAGNVVTYNGAKYLADNGADIIKVGMSGGGFCITQGEKAVGRANMTAALAVDKAIKDSGKDISLILDGGISTPVDMIIGLTIGHGLMFGSWCNSMFEAAGEKYDKHGIVTTREGEIVTVAGWGEGSEKARALAFENRYGHTSKKTFFAEGGEGVVPYSGRLKPNVEAVSMRIRSAMSNAGCKNLEEFRKEAVVEVNSSYASEQISTAFALQKKR